MKKVDLFGINYAGRADKTDFVQQLSYWADASEAGYHFICDGIFVGSSDHANNVCDHFGLNPATVYRTGLVWDLEYMNQFPRLGDKEDFVIWPHRFSKEKGIDELVEFAKFTDKKIIITSSGPAKDLGKLPKNIEYRHSLTKSEYFDLMRRAKWYLSTAYQETFGYTIQEAIYFGCEILVPNRACCPEMVPAKNVYESVYEIETKFNEGGLVVPMSWTEKWDNNAQTMIDIIKEN